MWFAYADFSSFETPSTFRVDEPLDTNTSMSILRAAISPSLLPTGAAIGHQISYDFYHPSACARQLGFGQLHIKFFFIGRLAHRCQVTSANIWMAISQLPEEVYFDWPADLKLYDQHTELFKTGWRSCKRHFFQHRFAIYGHQIDASIPVPTIEVIFYPLRFMYLCRSIDQDLFLHSRTQHRRRA